MSKLRVAIDFRVEDARQGIGTAVLALAHGLSRLRDVDQEYIFVVTEQNLAWIKPHVSGPCSVVAAPARSYGILERVKLRLQRTPFLNRLQPQSRSSATMLPPPSDGFLESLHCDVVHFPTQMAYLTNVPSIYQPWDLQHCHFPEFFTPEDVQLRNVRYTAFCHQARYVCVQTEWGKQDLIRQYGIQPDKIVVIRWGTAFEAYHPPVEADISAISRELNLPEKFFLYPAVTWPHKNHELLLKAIAQLRANGRPTHLVFTGAITPYRQHLDAIVRELNIEADVHFLGFVTDAQIQVVYRLATALIFPSKFEGLGLPVLEAFRVGLPVLCSSATVLPEVVGQAALLFDATSPAELIAAIEEVDKEEMRIRLIKEGESVLERYSADKAAMEFVSLYRATAGRV